MTTADSSPDGQANNQSRQADSIIVRPLPSFVVLYPTMLVAFLAGILGLWGGYNLSFAFLLTILINFLILAFDFDRITTIALVAIIGFVVLAVPRLNLDLELIKHIVDFKPEVEPAFYLGYGGIMFVIFIWVFIDTRFDYWEITPNELMHHHGFMGDVERFPAPNLSMKKEIHDVFEFLLMGSGRLLLYPSGKDRPVVLDNVMRINKVEDRVKTILASLRVKMID